ncbi:MAG: chemotaxis response regulator protein-glutamate methylesterase [Lachnospiraceae bacterium]|nr:chemotaxis response regulator protein-glutamate methylesterase [Lachnospiraceae bacterium]
MKKVRVLVVDDSFVIRNILQQSLDSDPEIEVVATACDAFEARDLIIKLRPDVMTLDIEMPRMNGLDFLKKLMPQYPMPVIVVSSLDDRVFDALEAGAVDFIHKPGGLTRTQLVEHMKIELNEKVKAADKVKVVGRKHREPTAVITDGITGRPDKEVIAIGASTGGTEAIYDIISKFNTDIPGVVIVQHMPEGFTEMFAERLDNQCQVSVKEAKTGDRVKQGQVLIAPGSKQMRLTKEHSGFHVECKTEAAVGGHCPSVNVLFESVAKVAGEKAVGVILTGMGSDGATGLMEMHRRGAVTIGQDEVSSIVYGMPKVAHDIGACTYQVGLSQMASKIYSVLNNKK